MTSPGPALRDVLFWVKNCFIPTYSNLLGGGVFEEMESFLHAQNVSFLWGPLGRDNLPREVF